MKNSVLSVPAALLLSMKIPYIWGGNNPLTGLDCSGFVCEVLRCGGFLNSGDYTAQGLFNLFRTKERGKIIHPDDIFEDDCLLFFGESLDNITHVAIGIDRWTMFEAGGGGEHIRTAEDAAKAGAYVRMRSISSRKDLVARLMVL